MPKTSEVRWDGPHGPLAGHLSVPDDAPPRAPGLVVIHEIWGLDGHIRSVADRFASAGFVTLAPQLYPDEVQRAMTPERIRDAMALLRSAPPEVQRDPAKMAGLLEGRSPSEQAGLRTIMAVMDPGRTRVFADQVVSAVDLLRHRPEADPRRLATLGFCFGGGLSVYAAGLDPQLRASVVFYGSNPPNELIPKIRAAVLGLYGAEDHRITDTVPGFAEAAARAGVRFRYHIYPGAAHAFFNDSRPAVYHEASAKDAWDRSVAFLREQLGP